MIRLLMLAVGMALAVPVHAATTLCIQAYPSSYDPGPSAASATRVDVVATGALQGFTKYAFGPGTGGGGDPADQKAFFHFAFPDNYTGSTFIPVLEVSSRDTQTGLFGCYQIGLTANTTNTVYANITALEGTTQNGHVHPNGTTGATVVLQLSPVTVYDPAVTGSCVSPACQGMTVVGSLIRLTSVCTSNDTATEDILDLHMCYTLP